VDAARTEADHYWDSYYIKFTSGSNAGLYRVITDWDLPTTTFTHLAFPNAVVAGDAYVLSDWQETKNNMAAGDATPSILHDDIFQIEVVFDAGAVDEWCYFEKDIPNISSDTYTHYVLRYKTDSASVNTKAMLVFTAGSQTILPSTSSTTWKTASGTVTAGKTIDKIRFYADDVGVDGTFHVYFDFLLICKGQFTFPHIGPGGVFLDFENKLAEIPMAGRDGDVLQHLGMKSPTIVIEGNVLSGESWESVAGPHFEYLLDAFHKDVWNWFTCDHPDLSFQVMFKRFEPVNRVTERSATLGYRVTLKVYKRSSLGLATWGDVEWVGYE